MAGQGPVAPRRSMVLAAGLGLRMRPLTESRPKPLLTLAGRTLLDHALDRLAEAGVADAVVNTHYLRHMIAAHLDGRSRPRTIVSPEDELLDTGGGIARALPHLGDGPFFAVNADIYWRDGATPALARLASWWQDDGMDALLLVHQTAAATGYAAAGDFFMSEAGSLSRRGAAPAAPYVFTGIQMLHPRLFSECPPGRFSLNLLFDRAIAGGRLYGLAHDGEWFHVGTPQALAEAEARLAGYATGTARAADGAGAA